MGRIPPALPLLAVLLALAGAPASGADLGPPRGLAPDVALPVEGVACGNPIVQSFPAVWQGHFQGGYSHYLGEGGPIVLDWRDEKRCFPSDGSCKRYIAEMRRDFHRPEGYFTCLPIR